MGPDDAMEQVSHPTFSRGGERKSTRGVDRKLASVAEKPQDDTTNKEGEQPYSSPTPSAGRLLHSKTLDVTPSSPTPSAGRPWHSKTLDFTPGEESSNKRSMQTADARLDFATVESHVQKYVLHLMEPSILRVTQQQLELDGLRNSTEKHSKLIQDIAVVSAKAEQQITTVDHFREQLAEWDNLRHAQEAKVKEDISTMRHELDGFRYDLERKESSIHGMQRTCDRLVGETNRMHDLQSSLQKYCEERVNAHSKLISRNRTELEAKQISLETKHNKLSDEVWGEEMNLKKTSSELKKTNVLVSQLSEEMQNVQKTAATVTQLEDVQEEVNEFVRDANTNVLKLNQSVGAAVTEVKQHFQTAADTIAHTNAALIQQTQREYQEELNEAASLRVDLMKFMEETEAGQKRLEDDVQRAHTAMEELVRQVREDVEDIDGKYKKDKSSHDVDSRSLRKRLEVVCDNSDMVLKGVENLAGIVKGLLESDRVGAALEVQDDSDRRKVALTGYKDKSAAGPGRAATPRPRKLDPVVGVHKLDPVISVDSRCMSCSGHAGTVMAGFKIACLQYQPSPVEYGSEIFDRSALLARRHELLEHANSALHSFSQTWSPRKMASVPLKEFRH